LPIHLGRGRLVEPALLDEAGLADGLEDADGAEADDVARVFRDVEGHAHVRLRAEVVYLVRLELVEKLHHLHRVGEVAVVKEELHAVDMRVAVKVVDAARVEGRGAADDPVHLVTLRQQQLGEVGTVLAGDAGNQGFFHR
jgi:hypothetical protein